MAGRSSQSKLVVVMLRGAVDGLSVVVPYGDPAYARNRAEIAIATPGRPDGALPLDARFGLHPALASMLPLWSADRLAFVHASGSPDPTRSHFDAQDYLETATPGRRSTPDGWMNRLLKVLADPTADAARRPVQAVNLGAILPRILTGPMPVASLPAGGADQQRDGGSPALTMALDRLYAEDAITGASWQAMRETRRAMQDAAASGKDTGMDAGMDPGIARGAVPLAGLSRDAARLGRLMRREPGMRAAFFSVGGWDTHTNQGGARGQLATRLQTLAGGLTALAQELDDRLDDTVVIVMSEFGRTVRQNGTQGTDHGHGNVMWLMGAGVRGGRVHGEWPGLEASALHEGRDLAVTTDFRQVIAAVLERHLQLDDRQMAYVLPEGPGRSPRPDLLAG
jgi:uncharacterized protein (DUF1501 family)